MSTKKIYLSDRIYVNRCDQRLSLLERYLNGEALRVYDEIAIFREAYSRRRCRSRSDISE